MFGSDTSREWGLVKNNINNINSGDPLTLGDVNGDGEITAQDASLILQLVAKKIGSESIIYDAADVNNDGEDNKKRTHTSNTYDTYTLSVVTSRNVTENGNGCCKCSKCRIKTG